MKIMTYNIMVGAVEPDPSRMPKVLEVLAEQDADVFGLQETKVTKGEQNELVYALRNGGTHPYDVVFDNDQNWAHRTGAALFSRIAPLSSQIVGARVKAVEMVFPTQVGDLSVCNAYLSHISEQERLPQVREVLEALCGKRYGVLMGDFNALSPEDGIPNSAVSHFSDRMKEKYCRDGKLCYDTIEAVLAEGFVDVGLQSHRPQEITDKTDLSGGTGTHTRPMRMDYIFATADLLPYIREFTLVREGLARTASDHFPWTVDIDEALFTKPSP